MSENESPVLVYRQDPNTLVYHIVSLRGFHQEMFDLLRDVYVQPVLRSFRFFLLRGVHYVNPSEYDSTWPVFAVNPDQPQNE